jgi:hypothetical protein
MEEDDAACALLDTHATVDADDILAACDARVAARLRAAWHAWKSKPHFTRFLAKTIHPDRPHWRGKPSAHRLATLAFQSLKFLELDGKNRVAVVGARRPRLSAHAIAHAVQCLVQ